MAANPNVVDTTQPEAIVPDTSTTPVTEPMITVEVQDRLLRELKRRLFPGDVEGILYSAIVGDLYWQDQLWSLMVDTWPRLLTNLGKLKAAVSSMEYAITPYSEADNEPSDSAMEKADFVKTALFGMRSDVARQEHDFKETLEDIVDSIIAGFTVMEVYWENRDGGIVPQCSRWLPARYYRYPYVLDDSDRLMLNPSGMLGGTQLVDFPPYKFLVCVKQSHANHPVFTSPMRCLTAWWIASRFGLEWFMTFAQLFGIPRRIAYYKPGDDVVYNQLVAMMRQSAAATWGVYPEGTKVEDQAAAGGSSGHMPQERLIEEADKVCDIMLLGQTLTTEVRESGGNRALGTVHRKVMDEVMEAAAKYCAKLITAQIIPGIVQYNFGNVEELPRLEPVINTPIDLFNLAQSYNILFNQMKIPVLNKELYARIEFTPPEEDDDVYQPPVAPPPVPFGAPRPSPEGIKPEPAGAPNGEHEPLAPNIVERVGAIANGHDDPDIGEDDDGDETPSLAASRKVSFALDYGEEPEPGEVLRFIEGARHDVRHPKTGRFIPKPKAAPKRKVGVRAVPEVGLMCKENVDMGDGKVCQACQDISAEGWIPVDKEFLGYSMNPPHHPNCRCTVDYKTRYRGVDIYHQTKSGNPHHHPQTGRFVSKPGRKVRSAFDPSEPRDEEGKWTSEGEKLKEGKVSDFLESHPLFDEHPWTKNVPVTINPNMNPMGRFIEGDTPQESEIHLKDASYVETLKHELVHLRQAIENKPRGGSSATAWMGSRRKETFALAQKLFKEIKTPRSLEDYAKAAGFDSPEEAKPSYEKEYLPGFKGKKNLDRMWRLAQEGAGEQAYRNLPGEKEARGEK